jgi:hypothetical protein
LKEQFSAMHLASGEAAGSARRSMAAFANRNHGRRILWTVVLLPLLMAASCRTYIVHVTVVNHTGGVVNLLEVDYPSASFGVDTLPAGGEYHYHLQLENSGPVKVQYTEGVSHEYKSTGPTVHERQHGDLEIILDPGGKIEFHPQLTPAS